EPSAIRRFLAQAASTAGQRLSLRIEVGSFDGVCTLVQAGVGIGVVPASIAARYAQSLRIRTIALQDAWASRELRICTKSFARLPSFACELVDALLAGARPLARAEQALSRSQMAPRKAAIYSLLAS